MSHANLNLFHPIRCRMLRHSADEAMDVAPVKGGVADDECAAPPPLPPPVKEVNNNVYAARGDDGLAASPPPTPSQLHPAASSAELEKAAAETAPEAAATAATVYSCGSLRLSVSARSQWLCVARLPRDFTREELMELVEEYGAVEETHMIHSETTGKQRARAGAGVGCNSAAGIMGTCSRNG